MEREAYIKALAEKPEGAIETAVILGRATFAEAVAALALRLDVAGVKAPHTLALCEAGRLVLKPGEAYFFEAVPGCKTCKELATMGEGI